MIQRDSIDEFVSYINQQCIPLDFEIENSIYETNPFLIKKGNHSLIEYAFFYGSESIFIFLKMSGVELTPLLWIYSIHSQNASMFHVLESQKVDFPSKSNYYLLKECIKCHHNNFYNYILENFQSGDDQNELKILIKSLKYYNFAYIEDKQIGIALYKDLIRFDYFPIVDILLKNEDIDINQLYECQHYVRVNWHGMRIDGYDRETALYIAALAGRIEIVKLLLSYESIDINKYSHIYNHDESMKISATPLHCAINNDNLEIVKILLDDKRIDAHIYLTNNKSWPERTPILLAVSNENLAMTKLLLTYDKVDPNYSNHCSNPLPLLLAVDSENIEMIKLLLNCGKIDLFETVKCNRWNLFKWKIITEETALFRAILRNNLEIVNLLLACKRYDVNVPVRRYNEELVQELSILDIAIEKKNLGIIKSLISSGRIDINLLSKSFDDKGKQQNEEEYEEIYSSLKYNLFY